MHWLLLAVLALLLILAASRYPRLAYSLLVVLIAVAAGLYYMSDPPAEGIPRELDTSEVVIENVTMVPYYAGAFRADGDISNRSEYFDLTELVIRFVLEDCPVDSSSDGCVTVSETEERVRVHVPMRSTRPFEQPVSPRRSAVEGERRWRYEVVSVTGRKPLREIID
ncbi:MAG: hypothetical protein M5U09_14420 [Gammaproteobacteria bacterium]|nr:hypothetical protein [Gammaproteobacteria bacterium]